ncbi:MAG: glutamine--fructose-6-phosphate transaminase (isomerizing) [Candidatus Diapherotrites archaeon]|nr:glutamine--fructose-6-phosphate transaminase (isomerizing) [Candidatus Diapherotrites archaeon]
MCGIVGYVGEKQAAPLIIEALKKLEYRGYDSSGISVLNSEGIFTAKKKGRIQELESMLDYSKIEGTLGIAHTRWATHGIPDEINAHPHLDCSGKIAIVHNGIIENYASLKEVLISEGHRIVSQTDSEIIAHLIEKFQKQGNPLEHSVKKALSLVEGTFGLAVLGTDKFGGPRIIAAKKGASLIIGIGNNEIILASDATAIINHTRKVIYLNDDEVAVLSKDGCFITKINGERVKNQIQEIKWSLEEIEKKNFKHFMLKEIMEQPEAVQNALRGRINGAVPKLSLKIDVNKTKRIILTACGTSWHSALIGKYLIEKIAQIPVEADYASEFRYRDPLISETDLVMAISQSGETADTLAALRQAKSKNAQTAGIVNVVGSTIAREVDSGIFLHAGPEIGVASTKAFTTQVVALALFALFLRHEKGIKDSPELMRELSMIPSKIKEFLTSAEGQIGGIAKEFYSSKNFLYLGRGVNFPVALEGALKLKEISYIHAEGYPAAEMKHGPIALVDDEMPVVFVATQSASTFDKITSNMQEIKARGGRIITITDEENSSIKSLSNFLVLVPKTIEELSPIINVLPLQLLAYKIADLKGLSIDKPRNLAKSVTVE